MNNLSQNQQMSEQLKMEGVSDETLQSNAQVQKKSPDGQISQKIPSATSQSGKIPAQRQFSGSGQIFDNVKENYEKIFNLYGQEEANNWLKNQLVEIHSGLQKDNEEVIKEIQQKYREVYQIPAVQKAISAYIEMDLNPSISLREQGFHEVVEHLSNIYNAGYNDAMALNSQNSSAKARMASAVNSAVPHQQVSKLFTRSDIKSMTPESFQQNEKEIFEQLGRGLIQ